MMLWSSRRRYFIVGGTTIGREVDMPEPEKTGAEPASSSAPVSLAGPVDPRLLLADVLAERVDRLLPWVDRQADQPTREAYLDFLVGLSASVEALRATESPYFADHVLLAIRSLEAARPMETEFATPPPSG